MPLYPGKYGEVIAKYENDINRSVIYLRNAFRENDKPRYVKGFRRGMLDEQIIAPLAVANEIGPHEVLPLARRAYKRRIDPISRRYTVQVMVDCSGSTSGYNIGLEKVMAATFCEMFFRVGVDFSVVGHTGSTYEFMTAMVKDFSDRWDKEHKSMLMRLSGCSANFDGTAMRYALDRVKNKPGPIIIYFSDGQFPAENATYEGPLAHRVIREAKNSGVILIAVGVRSTDIMKKGFTYAIHARRPPDGAKQLVPLLQKLLLKPNF